jgi:hypothetical protein
MAHHRVRLASSLGRACLLGAFLLSGTRANVALSVTTLAQWSNWGFGFSLQPDTASANNTTQMLSTHGGANAPSVAQVGGPEGYYAYAAGWMNGANTKYWQITMNTTGFVSLVLSSKHVSLPNLSGAQGPRDFKVQYSTNGTTWTDVAGGSFMVTTSWTQAVNNLSLPVACENQATLYIRWIMTSNLGAVNGMTLLNGNGQAQIDDVVVSSTAAGNVAPSMTMQPTNQTVCAGQSADFTAAATGSPAPTVQWQVNNGSGFTNIMGATSTTYSHSATAGENGYQYRAVFTNAAGGATSNAATLTVNTAPMISVHPQDSTCANPATFMVTANGTALTYQWQENTGAGFLNVSNGGVYGGVTTATLTLTNPLPTMNGYLYRCVVGGTCMPSATSNPATLNVDIAEPTVTAPGDATATQTLCQ